MKLLVFIVMILVLSGCSSTPKDKYSDLYLRSEFTWWEAKPEFKFKTIKDSIDKSVTAKIEADGNSYHIKVADNQWSQDKNCGYKNPEDRVIELNKWIELECSYDFDKLSSTPIQKPLEIKPSKTSFYTFTLKMTVNGPSHIKVERLLATRHSH
jgi:hypothetical protein